MKLRNKNTGKVKDLSVYGDIVWLGNYRYNSLAELNEEWEDYAPKEPLIKDEKIRKIVKVWAHMNNIEKVIYSILPNKTLSGFIDEDVNDTCISFIGLMPILVDGNDYTIAELCGEEE